MHRHQIVGILVDLISGKNVLVVVDKLDDVPPILHAIEYWDGDFEHAKLRICKVNGRQEVSYAGHWIKFVSSRSPRGIQGFAPDVLCVDEESPGINLSVSELGLIEAHGAERVPMVH
ncbi:hypothetical protein [Brevibacterium aurantiacum]|uniref:hypothetical protein n=1 Tax=Brevibacterium aurantiacum TaxID=273384 RepID=UPI003F8F7B90